MFGRLSLIALFVILASLGVQAQQREFWLGADISGTTMLEGMGVKLYDINGVERENTLLMKSYGLNAVRLRVWVNPKDGYSSAEDVLVMAKRAQALGMELMIDFHYSDWWADPGKQNIPESWKDYSLRRMKRALAGHTSSTLQLLKDNGIDVKWVQVGNETTHGFLWPMGRAETNMKQYAALSQAGYRAVKKVYPQAKVIIHLDGGCDEKRYDFIFDGLKQYGAQWDIIGLSVYPYWDQRAKMTSSDEETLEKCISNINRMYKKYGTDLMIVETGVEAKQPETGKLFISKLLDAAYTQTDGHCLGVFYWAPELEGHYPLGAFNNHKPTVIMDAFKEFGQKYLYQNH